MLDIEAIKKDCEKIKSIVDDALRIVKENNYFPNEAMLTHRIYCSHVDYKVIMENYVAEISNASENCQGLQKFVYKHLADNGFENVEVNTEW